jgi:predicted CXXCH cytochrome family protein
MVAVACGVPVLLAQVKPGNPGPQPGPQPPRAEPAGAATSPSSAAPGSASTEPAKRSGALLNPPTGPAGVRPTLPVRNCTNAGCHAEQIKHTLLHGPVAVNACDVCHVSKDAGAHTFQLKRQGKDLCTFCHIDSKTGGPGDTVHKPVAEGSCISCHNPHGSEVRSMLQQPTVNKQCLQCHTEVMKGAHAHKPASDDCTQCHQSHASSHAKLLKADREQLCVTCHQDVQKKISTAAHPHKPVTSGDCYLCHSPHSSDHVAVLQRGPKDLCLSCHDTMNSVLASAKHPHSAATDGKACLNCHSPHGSEHAKQLKASTLDACMTCHDKPIAVGEKRTIHAVNELRVDEFYKHGPINKDDCGACHAVHGGHEPSLLVAKYSTAFYTNKEPDASSLCFKCHDAKLLIGPVEGKLTAFRNGERNLHALHVGQGPGQQSRSCRACHTVHASRFENMVADSVKFGEWSLPVNYTRTPTGGSCAPGCHKPEPYDREVPGRMPPNLKPATGATSDAGTEAGGGQSTGGGTPAAPIGSAGSPPPAAPGSPAPVQPATAPVPAPAPAPAPDANIAPPGQPTPKPAGVNCGK